MIYLVNLIPQKYGIRILHHDSHNFDVHFSNEKKIRVACTNLLVARDWTG